MPVVVALGVVFLRSRKRGPASVEGSGTGGDSNIEGAVGDEVVVMSAVGGKEGAEEDAGVLVEIGGATGCRIPNLHRWSRVCGGVGRSSEPGYLEPNLHLSQPQYTSTAAVPTACRNSPKCRATSEAIAKHSDQG